MYFVQNSVFSACYFIQYISYSTQNNVFYTAYFIQYIVYILQYLVHFVPYNSFWTHIIQVSGDVVGGWAFWGCGSVPDWRLIYFVMSADWWNGQASLDGGRNGLWRMHSSLTLHAGTWARGVSFPLARFDHFQSICGLWCVGFVWEAGGWHTVKPHLACYCSAMQHLNPEEASKLLIEQGFF